MKRDLSIFLTVSNQRVRRNVCEKRSCTGVIRPLGSRTLIVTGAPPLAFLTAHTQEPSRQMRRAKRVDARGLIDGAHRADFWLARVPVPKLRPSFLRLTS
jgi:hypothetical protein